MSISGVSTTIDQYIYERCEMGLSPALPQPTMQEGFQQFLAAIERASVCYATDCALVLLNFNDDEQKAFIKAVREAKEAIAIKKKTMMFCFVLEDGVSGVSFCVAPTETEDDVLFSKMMSFASAKKHETRCHHWAAFGWKAESRNEANVMGHLSYEWQDEDERDPFLARQT